jgi:hypothetical protein
MPDFDANVKTFKGRQLRKFATNSLGQIGFKAD